MKNEYWNLVLTGAFVLGVLYAALNFLSYVFYGNPIVGYVTSIGGFALIAWALIFYGKKVAAMKDVDGVGFSYGQAFGFSLLMLILSGVIVGIGQWTLQNVIDPDFFAKVNKEAIETMVNAMGNNLDDKMLEQIRATQAKTSNIWWVVISTIFSMGLLGGLVALVTSAVVRRKPQMF